MQAYVGASEFASGFRYRSSTSTGLFEPEQQLRLANVLASGKRICATWNRFSQRLRDRPNVNDADLSPVEKRIYGAVSGEILGHASV